MGVNGTNSKVVVGGKVRPYAKRRVGRHSNRIPEPQSWSGRNSRHRHAAAAYSQVEEGRIELISRCAVRYEYPFAFTIQPRRLAAAGIVIEVGE